MKIVFKGFLYIITFFLMVACADNLDLTPQQNVNAKDELTTSEGVINFLNGAYAEIAGQLTLVQGGELYGGDFNLISELLGSNDEVAWSGTFATYRQIRNRAIIDNNLVIASNWTRAYDAINISNLVLTNTEVVEQSMRNIIRGEALAIRSFLFFELVRLYALPYEHGEQNLQPGIPLVVTPTLELADITADTYVSRGTVEGVYNRVIADLVEAASLLPETNGIRLNKYAVLAMLSRVYLQKGDFEAARDAANKVIEEGGFVLLSDFTRCFNNQSNTTEDIFAIQQNSLFNAGTNNSGLTTFYANSSQSGRDGDIDVLPKHMAIYEPGDIRGSFFYPGESDGLPKTSKWLVEYANIPVMRLAEMYLTRAECNFRLGTSVGATPIADLNSIRARAGLGAYDAVLSLDEILLERRRELAFEGLQLHDLKRNKRSVSGVDYNAPTLVLPIPRREKENNSNING